MISERGKVIIFRSIHDAIKAEGLLAKSGYQPRVVPIPKDVSSDCGIALRLDAEVFNGALEFLEKAGVFVMACVDEAEH